MEWFNQNANTIIAACSALGGVVITALFALMNNILSIKAADKQRQEQIDFEKWKAKRQIYIENGEEVISLISSVSQMFLAVVNSVTMNIVSSNDKKVTDAVRDTLLGQKSGEAFDRLDTLITAYFPTLAPFQETMKNCHLKGVSSYIEFISGQTNIERHQLGVELLQVNNDLKTISREFKTEVSAIISKHM